MCQLKSAGHWDSKTLLKKIHITDSWPVAKKVDRSIINKAKQ